MDMPMYTKRGAAQLKHYFVVVEPVGVFKKSTALILYINGSRFTVCGMTETELNEALDKGTEITCTKDFSDAGSGNGTKEYKITINGDWITINEV